MLFLRGVKKELKKRKEKEKGGKKGMSIQATSIYVDVNAEKFFHFALCKSILPFR